MPLPDRIGYADLYEVAPTSAIDRSGVRPLNEWMEILNGVHAGYLSVQISDTPPASPYDGSFWWQSSSGRLFIRYNDGNSTQWCETVGRIAGDISAGLVTATDGETKTLADWMADVATIGPNGSVPTERGFWTDDPSGANIYRFRDRVLVGDAVENDGARTPTGHNSWLASEAGGYMAYFETRSQFEVASSNGGLAITAGTRTSDNEETYATSIAVGAYANNDRDEPADKKYAWAFYGTAVNTRANAATIGMELDIANLVADVVTVTPYQAGATGTTAAAWLALGGETVQQQVAGSDFTSAKPVSVGLALVNTAPQAVGNRYRAGIVIATNALLRATPGDETTKATAIAVARGHQLQGYFDNTTLNWWLRGDGNSGARASGLVFTSTGMELRGVASDLSTETTLLQMLSAAVPVGQGTNYVTVAPQVTAGGGAGDTNMVANGADTNIRFVIRGKGTQGVVLQDGNAIDKFRCTTTGIGFFGTSPIAKPTVGAALSTGGAETNTNLATRINELRTALVNLGLAA